MDCCSSLHVQILANFVFCDLIDNVDLTLEYTPHRPVVRELQRRRIIMQLAEIVALGEDSIAPRRDASLFRSIVDVRSWVEFVGRQERRRRL